MLKAFSKKRWIKTTAWTASTHFFVLAVVIASFAVVGMVRLFTTSAASVVVTAEPEKGTIQQSATVVSDTAASGGQAVRFGVTQSGTKLRWAPPSSNSWQNLRVGGNTSPKEYTLAANTDYNIIFDSPAKGRLTFIGGRHIKIIGGEIDIATPAFNTSKSSNEAAYYNYRNGLVFKGTSTGTIHIEGLHIHGQYALDSIQANEQSSRTFIIQNSRLECNTAVSGLIDVWDKVYHTDGFQSWGGINGLYMNRVTIVNPYQGGMFGDGALVTPWKTTILDKVNYRGDTKVGQKWKLVNFVSSGGNLQGPITLQGTSVYYKLGPNWTWNTGSSTSGFHGNMFNFGTDTHGRYAEPWQSKVTGGVNNGSGGPGRVYSGIPPSGDDYVPASVPGMNYVSPGYQ